MTGREERRQLALKKANENWLIGHSRSETNRKNKASATKGKAPRINFERYK